jgi:hypothetical protein
MDEGFALEVTVKIRYNANPSNYGIDPQAVDEGMLPYHMAQIDATNFADDPDLLFNRLAEDSETVITVAPIHSWDD